MLLLAAEPNASCHKTTRRLAHTLLECSARARGVGREAEPVAGLQVPLDGTRQLLRLALLIEQLELEFEGRPARLCQDGDERVGAERRAGGKGEAECILVHVRVSIAFGK